LASSCGITGRDLSPLLSGAAERVYGPDDKVGYELTDHGVLFQGDYKLVINQPPVGDGQLKQFFSNTLLKSKNDMLVFLLTLLLLVPFYVAYRMSREIKK
jgi:hypothetical protein